MRWEDQTFLVQLLAGLVGQRMGELFNIMMGKYISIVDDEWMSDFR